ncbi:type II secretion system minor pseudopilin GspK [Blastomonas fulva]|uniref:type II secretion system minor pseudopilin GspK n=1 Tax=Blastomonas fulva TaxID=1550728 RepID=UPI0025A3C905|nr:type II secretion system minor pseudopilin GspK [Blastomonas fulva]MDM7929297.1 type II secretion system minor pseudopilin GspK [Blastomonas fulva]MDM7966067.1 type II secretion system minor pseudopilin GspK [Blastomonas fulva]
MSAPGRPSERGIALLSVLLLVAVMAIVTTLILDRVNLAVRLAGNAGAADRARFAALGAEGLAAREIKRRLDQSPARTVNVGGWLGAPMVLPVDDGSGATVTATVRDGGNCFNLNSVVAGQPGDLAARPVGIGQFAGLMTALGVPAQDSAALADALADWIDTDSVPLPAGAEDQFYMQGEALFRTAGQLLGDKGEVQALRGMTPQLYARLEPWICALPDAILSPINVNTLLPEQAPLIMMLAPGQIPLERARRLIEQRPPLGYARIADFWRPLALQSQTFGPEIESQPQIVSRWFELDLVIAQGESRWRQTSLLDAQLTPARIIARRIGEP